MSIDLQVDKANPPFPRDASKWWLKCKQRNSNKLIDESDYENCDEDINESNDPSGRGFFNSVADSLNRVATFGNIINKIF